MAPLPKERVQRALAFQFTGLDYLGPLTVKNPGTYESYKKRWIDLLTCFTTGAIHLELVPDCTAESALNALKRFISRRGTPEMILSDNAGQFGKASKALQHIWEEKVCEEIIEGMSKFFSDKEIKWKNIPECSPWVGGFYERLVGLVKRAIKKTLWRATISDDQLHTLICMIEGILNNRPLLSISGDNIEDYKTLCPADFIAPGSQLNLPPSDMEKQQDPDYHPNPKAEKELTSLYSRIQKKLDNFWKIWNTHYLQQLRETHMHSHSFKRKKGQVTREPQVGEVTLIKDVSPRATWKLGRIEKVYHGEDGAVRFAQIKFPSGNVTRRGVQDLVPLELELGNSDQDTKGHLLTCFT